MATTGVVRWFDRSTGIGVVALDDGGLDCVVVRLDQDPAALAGGIGGGADGNPHPHAPLGASAGSPPAVPGRARWPDIADATRAATWGDGGRDY